MRLLDGYNLTVGAILAIFTKIFDQYGTVLVTFLIFNILDWITGTCKARICKKESSIDGLKGICKKLGYWVLIFVAFLTGQNLMIMGTEMGISLDSANYLGWLTLAMLIVNEARSIAENLVEMGVQVPEVLIRGLAIAEKNIDSVAGTGEEQEQLVSK